MKSVLVSRPPSGSGGGSVSWLVIMSCGLTGSGRCLNRSGSGVGGGVGLPCLAMRLELLRVDRGRVAASAGRAHLVNVVARGAVCAELVDSLAQRFLGGEQVGVAEWCDHQELGGAGGVVGVFGGADAAVDVAVAVDRGRWPHARHGAACRDGVDQADARVLVERPRFSGLGVHRDAVSSRWTPRPENRG